MMTRFLYLTLLSAALLQSNHVLAETVFIEQEGRLVVEVESVPAVSDWHASAEFPDYRGSGHLEWTGSNNNSVRNAGDGTLTYHFRINTPGNYEFRWRSYIGEGTRGTESNDSWVRFPTGTNVDDEQPLNGWTKAFMNAVGEWSWRTVTVDFVGLPLRQYFAAGDHTVEISGRSRGHVIDRFTLFNYDTVRFNNTVFSDAPQSPSTGDAVVVLDIDPPVPENNTDLNTDDADSAVGQLPVAELTQQFQVPANQLIANECRDGVISLRPVSDIFVEANEIVNTGDLRLDGDGRSALLQFDLSNVPATVNSAVLTWSAGADAGEGSVLLSAGSHSNWNETDASLLPDISHLIGSFNGTWSQENRYGFPFDHTLIGTGKATLIMQMAQGANDLSIMPSISNDEPRLQLTGPATFCGDYEANQNAESDQELAQPEQEPAEFVQELTQPDQELIQPDQELTTKVNSVPEAESTGGGSLWLLELFLLTSFLSVLRRCSCKKDS